MRSLRKGLSALIGFLFPCYCEVCGTGLKWYEYLVCSRCFRRLPRLTSFKHWMKVEVFKGEGRWVEMLVPFEYRDPVARWIRLLKFSERIDVAKGLGVLLRREFGFVPEADLVVPVPLSRRRLFERGYNQSYLIAKAVFGRAETSVIRRVKHTLPQTELSEAQRRVNVKGAFKVMRKEAVSGRSVILVDDVITTGATVCECVRELYRAGAREVKVVAVSRRLR